MTAAASATQKEKIRILVVDDHPIVRQGLAQLIAREPNMSMCAEAEDAAHALKAIETAAPNFVIVDISMKGPDGIDLLKSIRCSHPQLPVLILSMHDESVYAERALRAGANGYMMKQEATENVLVAVRRIWGGEIYISDKIASKILRNLAAGPGSAKRSTIESLTDRELEVFQLIGRGCSTREIAEELHVSVKTVETYHAHIKEKLSLRNVRELVQHAAQWVAASDNPA
jgi:DNA-binding NarL/FixJ family response regulator